MAVVTGDRYLDLLSRFVEEHAGALLDGSLVLKLNPVGLHYLQTRLDALQELERLRTGAPVDYLRAYIADLGDHRALEQLRRVLSLLSSVKVVSVLPTPNRDPSTLTLSPFGRLRSLELRGCNLSTSAARGLLELRPILERLICHNSADALRHIFTERIVEIKDAQVWSRLAFVSCASNRMLLMDESLHLLPAVQFMDLSRNRFAKATNLHRCLRLKFLDLGFNQLQNISSLSQIKGQLTKLVLRNNALLNVHGIAALTSLEALDLSHNLISKFKEIKSLASIQPLKFLLLEGNPLSVSSYYREEVFSLFPDPSKVNLDGRKITRSELWTVNSIVSYRQKEEAVYGLYAPAETSEAEVSMIESENTMKHSADGAANVLRGKRKASRLAPIQDAHLHIEEASEQEESPRLFVSSNNTREKRSDVVDEVEHTKDEAYQLMQKVEALKEEGSKTWLQDLKALLENNGRQTGLEHKNFELQSGKHMLLGDSKLKELRRRWSRRRRRLKQRSFEEDDQVSHLGQGHNVRLQTHFILSEGSPEPLVQEKKNHLLVDTNLQSNAAATCLELSGDTQSISEMKNSSGQMKALETDASGNADENMQRGLGYAADEEQTSMDESFGSWRIIEELVESRGQTEGIRSPPQYHEEVLQKRQNLEEELLRLSLDSGCAPSSNDSETSSEDTLMTVSSSQSSADGFKDRVPSAERLGFSFRQGQSFSHDDKREGNLVGHDRSNSGSDESMYSDTQDGRSKLPGEQHSINMHKGTNVPKEKSTETLRTGHFNPACADDILANAGGGGNQNSLMSSGSTLKAKRKKRRVRMVELSEHGESRDKQVEQLSVVGASSAVNHILPSDVKEAANGLKPMSIDTEVDTTSTSKDPIEELFCHKFGAEEGEVCLQHIQCGCLRRWEDTPFERDIHLLLSSSNNLYMLADSSINHSSIGGPTLHVIASHKLWDVKKIVVGLGLQALRVDIGHSASYVLVTRNVNISGEILDMLRKRQETDGPAPYVQSWEHKQLRMFEELVLGGAKTSILMYLMPLFCYGKKSDNVWVPRSVFLTSNHIFLCMEDLVNFGVESDDLIGQDHPYITMAASANICDLSEVVADLSDGCVTLNFKKFISGPPVLCGSHDVATESKHQIATTWKFKGVLDQVVSKLVALLRASHMEVTMHPLTVKDHAWSSCEAV